MEVKSKSENTYKNAEKECKITYIHVKINDISTRIREILSLISDDSWVNTLEDEGDRISYKTSVEQTIKELVDNIFKNKEDEVTAETGEYIISSSAQIILADTCKHQRLPLAELWKEKIVGNPGFDFHTLCSENMLFFGEAKYSSSRNSYGSALSQIVNFISSGKDIREITDLRRLNSNINKDHYNKEKRGYIAAFSLHNNFENILTEINANSNTDRLKEYPQLCLVGIEICT